MEAIELVINALVLRKFFNARRTNDSMYKTNGEKKGKKDHTEIFIPV